MFGVVPVAEQLVQHGAQGLVDDDHVEEKRRLTDGSFPSYDDYDDDVDDDDDGDDDDQYEQDEWCDDDHVG